MKGFIITVTTAIVLASLVPAHAQEPRDRRSPVLIGAVGGLSAGTGHAGGSIGATLALDLGHRLGVEGRGVFFGAGHGSDAFEISASLLVDLLDRSRGTVPYLAVGAGMYRARLDLDDRRFLGGFMDEMRAGGWLVPQGGGFGMMDGTSSKVIGHMPSFYASRMGAMQVPADGMWGMRRFTDPVVTFGGGIRLDVSEHMSVRPDVRALVIMRDGHMTTVSTLALGIGYRF